MGRAFPCPSSHHEHAFQMTVIHVDLYHLSQKSTFFNNNKEIHIIFKTVIKITVLFASINLMSPFMNNKKRYRL